MIDAPGLASRVGEYHCVAQFELRRLAALSAETHRAEAMLTLPHQPQEPHQPQVPQGQLRSGAAGQASRAVWPGLTPQLTVGKTTVAQDWGRSVRLRKMAVAADLTIQSKWMLAARINCPHLSRSAFA